MHYITLIKAAHMWKELSYPNPFAVKWHAHIIHFTGRKVCRPARRWGLRASSHPPNRQVCEHTCTEQEHGWYPEKKKKKIGYVWSPNTSIYKLNVSKGIFNAGGKKRIYFLNRWIYMETLEYIILSRVTSERLSLTVYMDKTISNVFI